MRGETGRGVGAGRLPSALLAGVIMLPLVLGACSAVPGWADPSDWFARDEAATRVGLAQGQAGQTQTASFPNLASVPDTPPTPTSSEARAKIMESLAADRANAEYSGERLVGYAPEAAAPRAGGGSVSQALAQAVRAQEVPVPSVRTPVRTAASGSTAGASPPPPSSPSPQTVQAPPSPQTVQAPPSPQAVQAPPPAQTAQAAAPAQTGQAAAPASAGKTQLRFPQFEGGGAAPQARAGQSELVAVIYFAHGSTTLNADDRKVLRQIVVLHRERGGSIRVVGHASAHTGIVDQVRHRMANLEISLQRANAVAAAIVVLGVERDEVHTEARGDAQPVYHEFMPTGEAGNRRTEIFLEY